MINCCFFEHTCTKLFVSLTQTWNLVNKTILKWVNKDPIYIFHFFFWDVCHREHFPKVKYFSHSKKKKKKKDSEHAGKLFWHSTLLVWQNQSALSYLHYCDAIRIIHLFLYFVTLSCNVCGGGTWTVSGMDKNTENLLSLILLLYWNYSMPSTQRCACFPDKNLNFWT